MRVKVKAATANILSCLHEQGVVIQVKSPIVHWCQLCESYEEGKDTVEGDWSSCNNEECLTGAWKWKLKADCGCFEPLIKEEKWKGLRMRK